MGALAGVGGGGYSWSSSFSGTCGVFLSFYAQSLYSSNPSNRGHGFQLRCLSEETDRVFMGSNLA
ncbi:hypothetical protein [uncultured Rikenella sp.]|uniref:hypothetical protein n=1 Tax=uncultured Rikenella sp. TaxID=368003 RepID=UPI0026341404|nr:hypothetical protein [uncultured Rikenella sp.]